MKFGSLYSYIRAYHSNMTDLQYGWPNLRTIALFVAVVEEGSVGAGARKLGIAQPNASRAIAELENELQANLLERHPRGAVPTPLGLAFAGHAREVLETAEEFRQWAIQSKSQRPMRLRIGASMTIAETLLPAWLGTTRKRVPGANIDVTVLNSAQVINEVQQGRLQLGFIETPHVPVRLHFRVVQEDELLVAIGPEHEWVSRSGQVSLRELAQTPLVVREPGSGTREALQELLADYVTVEPAQVLSSNAAVRVAVASGVGPAVLSELALRDQFANGHLLRVPFEGSGISRPLTAIWSGPRRLTALAGELVAVAANRA